MMRLKSSPIEPPEAHADPFRHLRPRPPCDRRRPGRGHARRHHGGRARLPGDGPAALRQDHRHDGRDLTH
ncbi:MAG: hypothetical protein EPO55_21110 [Reyranella sp.]|nr:MAG: hypothetical protein EPO55_21110 [Reyranella sp.]